jgi:predicted Fe-Mo cluster-binding NifX family protein
MKVTIPTIDDNGLQSFVSEHFGRSPFFTVVDMDTEAVHSISNQGQHFGGSQHPAAQAADTADVILCAGLGQRALRYFQERNIEVYTGASGRVRDTLQSYREGKLRQGSSAGACPGRH